MEVHVACRPDEPYLDELRLLGFTVHPIHLPRRLHLIRSSRGFVQLVKLIRSIRFHVVHLHQPMAALVGIPAARMAGAPKVLYTSGGLKSHERMGSFKQSITLLLERALFRNLTMFFSVNREDIETARRWKLLPPERVYYVGARGGCGIDTQVFRPATDTERLQSRKSVGLKEDEICICTVGRLVREKGYEHVLAAIEQLRTQDYRAQLIIIGEGPDREWLKRKIVEHELTSVVTVLGARNDVAALLRCADIFVLASEREGLPVALLEAMATGLPCVATAVRGSREVIADGINGLMVQPANSHDLADALRRLIADCNLRSELGATARKTVVMEHGSDVLFPMLTGIYTRVVNH